MSYIYYKLHNSTRMMKMVNFYPEINSMESDNEQIDD